MQLQDTLSFSSALPQVATRPEFAQRQTPALIIPRLHSLTVEEWKVMLKDAGYTWNANAERVFSSIEPNPFPVRAKPHYASSVKIMHFGFLEVVDIYDVYNKAKTHGFYPCPLDVGFDYLLMHSGKIPRFSTVIGIPRLIYVENAGVGGSIVATFEAHCGDTRMLHTPYGTIHAYLHPTQNILLTTSI